MNQRPNRTEPQVSGKLRPVAIVIVLASVLAACSSVPDWANPARLYDQVSSVFTSDGDDEAFPTASDVPDRPETTTAEARRETAEGLVADRENAQYTDDEIRREARAQVAAVAPTPAPVPAPRPAPPPRQERVTTPEAAPRPTPAPPQQVAEAPARPSILESRRVDPRASADRPVAEDSLDARRTITSGRTTLPATTVAPRRVAPQVVERRAPAPAPPAVPRAPVTVGQAPAPTPAPAPVVAPPPVVAQAPTPQLALPRQPMVAIAPGQTVVSQTFARMLQDSASTVSTAPANASFNLPSAAPIQAGERPVSPIVRDTYNAALAATERSIGQTSGVQSVGFQGKAVTDSSAVTVQFGHDSARIPRAGRTKVRGIVEQYKARGGVIRVVGHASSKTRNMPVAEHNLANFKVSLDRAQAVANELIRLGVPPEAVFVEARGAADPAFFESMPAGEAGNRRVEIFLDFSTS